MATQAVNQPKTPARESKYLKATVNLCPHVMKRIHLVLGQKSKIAQKISEDIGIKKNCTDTLLE